MIATTKTIIAEGGQKEDTNLATGLPSRVGLELTRLPARLRTDDRQISSQRHRTPERPKPHHEIGHVTQKSRASMMRNNIDPQPLLSPTPPMVISPPHSFSILISRF